MWGRGQVCYHGRRGLPWLGLVDGVGRAAYCRLYVWSLGRTLHRQYGAVAGVLWPWVALVVGSCPRWGAGILGLVPGLLLAS